MEDKKKRESGIRRRLNKQREKALEDAKKIDEEIMAFKLKEAEKIADRIAKLFPNGVPMDIYGEILAILVDFQKKTEEPFNKLLEMERMRRIMELQDTRIDDPDWWVKASAAKILGITIPGMEELPDLQRKSKTKIY